MGILLWRLELIFLGVTKHRLVPARARSEWKRLRDKGIPSVWSPASKGFSPVGVVSPSAPVVLPTFAIPGFSMFLVWAWLFAVWCLWCVGGSCIW